LSAPYHNKALPQGTILREWRLEEVLGTGGFGIVYRGKGVYFGEDVAIKEYFPVAISDRREGNTVAPQDSDSEEIYDLGRKKFLEEAKVLWNLSRPQRHPNIVSVRSLFEINGTAYMVMDFESGTSLSEMLHEGRTFDEKSLFGIIRPIAEGLDRAHQAGVLHRDIKPANILINGAGTPVLIDFGSARFDSGQATNTKVTFYTPPYAAIEQYVKTFPQGPWTDIYALGVVLYQCVSGEKPPEVLERLHGGLGQALSALVGELHASGKIDSAAYDLHGLRHTIGVELCLAGATDAQGAAWLGHSSPHSFTTYRRQASRMLLTASAGDLLAELRKRALGTPPEQGVQNEVQKSAKQPGTGLTSRG